MNSHLIWTLSCYILFNQRTKLCDKTSWPITWQRISAFRHGDMTKRICRRTVQTEHQNGEETWFMWLWTQRGSWSLRRWFDCFRNCWSTGILMHRHENMDPSCLVSTVQSGGGSNDVGDIFLAHFGPRRTNRTSFKHQRLCEPYSWACPSLYDYSLPPSDGDVLRGCHKPTSSKTGLLNMTPGSLY